MSDDEGSAVTEGELAMKKRREQANVDSTGLEEADKELLDNNRQERSRMEDEIRELRERNEKRKKEREIEEKRLAAERAAEDQRRKADEEDRKRKKEEEESRKKGERALKMAEFEKWKTPPKANFVISKKLSAASGEEGDDQEEVEGKARKSKEQLEAEKQAILKQRLKPLDIDGADTGKLTEKAKELHTLLARLEGEKYDLEKRFKNMQVEMMQLAERARQANKVGKEGTVKRVTTNEEASSDKIMERFAGAPSKVEMFSKYERQKDKRTYDDRKVLYTGPQFGYPADRIKPNKIVKWSEEGLPLYEEMGGQPAAEPAA
jgi:troponin T